MVPSREVRVAASLGSSRMRRWPCCRIFQAEARRAWGSVCRSLCEMLSTISSPATATGFSGGTSRALCRMRRCRFWS